MSEEHPYDAHIKDLSALGIETDQQGRVNFTGTISAGGDEGLTGQRTIAGYTLTFKKGLLVGFQAP